MVNIATVPGSSGRIFMRGRLSTKRPFMLETRFEIRIHKFLDEITRDDVKQSIHCRLD